MGFQEDFLVVVSTVTETRVLNTHSLSSSAAGLVTGFTGDTVAVTFGSQTIDTTLVGYRLGGMDWQFTNVTAGGTHLFVSNETAGVGQTYPVNPQTFELRVTNWGYGIQIDQVHVAAGESLVKIPNYGRAIEFIGDSLSSGMYTSYEGLSSFAVSSYIPPDTWEAKHVMSRNFCVWPREYS